MRNRSVLFFALSFLFAPFAFAQQMYRWQDDKGQWHYSNFVPSGVVAEKFGPAEAAPKAVAPAAEPRKTESNSDRSNETVVDIDPAGFVNRRLLVFPPADASKPFSDWIPVESFATAEECDKAKALQIAGAITASAEVFRGWSPDMNSRCISLDEFELAKEAKVIVAVSRVTYDPVGFSTPIVYGRVFNRGHITAREVVVKYQVRDNVGTVYAEGQIPTSPTDIPPIMFGEFRGQIVGLTGLSDRRILTEAVWLSE